MTPPPERVTLTSEEGEGSIDRVYSSNLPRADCRALVQIVRQHFWLLLAIQEAKLSLKRFRQMLFGEPTKGRAASVSSAPSTEAEKSERNAALARPIVMSDALAANAADECRLIRCHCLAHGQRKFRLLAEVFPDECARVMAVLKRCSSTTSRRKRHS